MKALLLFLAIIMYAKQGDFIGVFPWEKEQLEWAKKFRIVELGDFEDIAQINTSTYPTPLAYEWLVGFYKKALRLLIDGRWNMDYFYHKKAQK